MSAKRRLFLAAVFVLGLISVVLIWPARKPAGSITFAGLTNNAAGVRWARFRVVNRYPRSIRFGVGEAQLYRTNGGKGVAH